MWASIKPMTLCIRCLLSEPRFRHVVLADGIKHFGITRSWVRGYPVLEGMRLLRSDQKGTVQEGPTEIILLDTLIEIAGKSDFNCEIKMNLEHVWVEMHNHPLYREKVGD